MLKAVKEGKIHNSKQMNFMRFEQQIMSGVVHGLGSQVY